MGLRDDLTTWNNNIADPLIDSTIGGGASLELGQVNDSIYDERKTTINNVLGLTDDYIDNETTFNKNSSSLYSLVLNDTDILIKTDLNTEEEWN